MPMAKILSFSGAQVDKETLEFIENVVDVLKERKERGDEHISGFELWSNLGDKSLGLGW